MYKIYIAEDDRTIASVLKQHLEKWGFEVSSPTPQKVKNSTPMA